MRCCSVGLLPSDASLTKRARGALSPPSRPARRAFMQDASVEQTTRARLTLFDLRGSKTRARESSAQMHRSIAACFRFSLWAMTVMF